MRLKYKHTPFSILLLSLLLFTSCEDTSSEDYLGESVPVPVNFSPLIADGINLGTTAATRASGTTWTANDKVGVYMVANGTGNPTLPGLAGNYQYQIASDLTSLTPVGDPIYYPVDGSSVNFVAYYPYKAAFTTAHTYPVDVSTQTSLPAIDLLYCARTSNSTPYSKTNTNASLTFKHQLVSLKVNVKGDTGNGVTSTHMTSPSFKITGMPRKANFALATGTLSTGTDAGDITPYRNTSASGASSTNLFWEGILVPNSSGTRSFVFTLGGTTYTYPVTQSFEAGKEYTFNLTLTTSGIVVNSLTITGWNAGAASWDGTNTLTVSEHPIIHDAAGTKVSGEATTVAVNYNTTATPVAAASSDASWITNVSIGTGTTVGSTGFKQSTLNYTLAENTTKDTRTGTINITAQGLTIPITVNQLGKGLSYGSGTVEELANCYMVYPGNMVEFPVTRAYEAGAIHGTLDEDYNGLFTVSILWKDAEVLADYYVINSGKNARIAVRAKNDGTQGNALVTLKNSSGSIVWSYHIWVTTYDPYTDATWDPISAGGNTINPRVTFMDRNLGAGDNGSNVASRGLFYQWGRKDPFPRTDIDGFLKVSAGIYGATISDTIENPGEFYYATSSPYDWHETRNSNFWVTSDDKKTIYDPCPAGWRVPTSGFDTVSPWSGLASHYFTYDDYGGLSWDQYGQYPAAGFRASTHGGSVDAGVNGRYWTATTTGISAHYLTFRSEYIHATGYGDRAHGCSVRCVKES